MNNSLIASFLFIIIRFSLYTSLYLMHVSFPTAIFLVALVNPICAVHSPCKTESVKSCDLSGIHNQPLLTCLLLLFAWSSFSCMCNEERGAPCRRVGLQNMHKSLSKSSPQSFSVGTADMFGYTTFSEGLKDFPVAPLLEYEAKSGSRWNSAGKQQESATCTLCIKGKKVGQLWLLSSNKQTNKPVSEHCSKAIAANKLFSVDRGDLHGGLQLQDYHLGGTALCTEISCGKLIGKLHSRVNLKKCWSARPKRAAGLYFCPVLDLTALPSWSHTNAKQNM